MIKAYYHLTKPGIIYGNAVTAAAGFFLAAKGDIDWKVFIGMLVGLSLIIGAGCVLNNYFDRDIDGKMERTKNRELVTGTISQRGAVLYSILLLAGGVTLLHTTTTSRALLAALFGFVVYVFIYTPLKRRTEYATLIGAFAGAVPPVVGYTSITNTYDAAAVILFVTLVFWQMPHFFAIGIFRLKDYAAAKIPIVPIRRGIVNAKIQSVIFLTLFLFSSLTLVAYHYRGYVFGSVMVITGVLWGWHALRGFQEGVDDIVWAKKLFRFSLMVLMFFSLSVSVSLHW